MACKTGKIGLPSKRKAEQKMHSYWRTVKPGPMPTRVYKCPFCSSWHMTSKPRRLTKEEIAHAEAEVSHTEKSISAA